MACWKLHYWRSLSPSSALQEHYSEVVSFPFLSPCTIQTGLPGAAPLTGQHLKLLLLIRFSQEQRFLCVLSWLCFMVPQHSREWCPWHVWGGERERSVSSEGALTSLHVTVVPLSPHTQVTAQSLLEFLLIVPFGCCFSRVCIWGKPKAIFNGG